MDKETLSNYGWIVVLVLILSVLLAFATPFGKFVQTATMNAVESIVGINDASMGIVDFTAAIGGTKTETSGNPDDSNIVVGKQENADNNDNSELNPNNNTIPVDNEKVNYGDYTYIYNEAMDGWFVSLNMEMTDRNKENYGPIMESINNKPIVSLRETFMNCERMKVSPAIPPLTKNLEATFYRCHSLEVAPSIPNGVTNMLQTFYECESITETPIIPSSVMTLECAFERCTSLEKINEMKNGVLSLCGTFRSCTNLKDMSEFVIPSTVTDVSHMFEECDGLIAAPIVPSNVMNISHMFAGCDSLSGIINVNCDPANYTKAIFGTKVTDVAGKTVIKNRIMLTKTNGNENPR